jgi:hypothetical protein
MNLHVNLIEEREKRLGGSLHMIFILRAIGVAIPVIVVLLLAQILISTSMATKEYTRTEELIAAKKPQLTLSAEVRKQQRYYGDMLGQLDSWKVMRIDWNRQLSALRPTVPLEVQVTSLHLTRTLLFTNNAPTSIYALDLRGKTAGAAPEANLTRFRLNILKEPGMNTLLAGVDVPEGTFVQDLSPGARPMDRLFELKCLYQPLVSK